MSYPEDWYCPITHALYEVPVIAEDGQTYEESAILSWLDTSNVSPITKTTISKEGLRINYSLKNTIESIVKGGRDLKINTSSIGENQYSPKLNVRKIIYDQKTYLNVKVISPEENKTMETLFICLIDISGSMGSKASIDTDSGEDHGFSRLDLVKHSLKTVVSSVNETDSISLITFSDRAQVIMDPFVMNSLNKTSANRLIDNLEPTSTTNIWEALRLGIEIAVKPENVGKNVSILLFTDGVPNNNPPRGIVKSLERLMDSTNINFTINSFGFGYELDSSLLRNISDMGNGSYSFIPDATMVGTIFVNFVANALLTCATNLELQIFDNNDHAIFENKIGSLQIGQDKDYIIEMDHTNFSVKLGSHVIQFCDFSMAENIDEEFSYHFCRNKITNLIGYLLENNANATHDSIAESIRNMDQKHSELVECFGGSEKISVLINDLKSTNDDEGQIYKSSSRLDWYQKWGKHYLLSIQRAHELQICNNFKDPGIQLYGGSNFQNLRDKIEDIFCSISPPTPSIVSYQSTGRNYNSAPIDMSAYMNAGGGCFDGNSLVIMEDATTKNVSSLSKGDKVFGGFKINCVVKTKIGFNLEVVELNGMLITPWHPVLINNEWKFPINIKSSSHVFMDYVYNIILDNGHIMIINDVKVVTLGHHFTDNNVVKHDYYGSDKVINDLMNIDGYHDGLVIIDKPLVSRGPNGHVTSIYL